MLLMIEKGIRGQICHSTEYNFEFQGSVQNLWKRALFMKFYPEIPWNNTEMH